MSNLLSGFFGALLGGFITWLTTGQLIKHQIEMENKRIQQSVAAFLNAIHTEITTLWEMYSSNVGKEIEALKDGEAFRLYWPMEHDYFTIFTGNSHLIGLVENSELRKAIVSTYSRAKGLIDSYNFNNELLKKFEDARHQTIVSLGMSPNPVTAEKEELILKQLKNYGTGLKTMHGDLKRRVEELVRLLEKVDS